MAEAVYILCAVTSFACALMLYRAFRKNKTALLLWSSLSFAAFTANNTLLVIDLLLIPNIDFSVARTAVLLLGFVLLLYGLIWEQA